MRRLILFRHAKAEPRTASGKDVDRPLAPRGRQDAAIIGAVLARQGLRPDLALVSASRRTRETWDCVAGAFPGARAEVSEDLYNASVEELMDEVQASADAADTVMVIGHNPGLHELAVNLLVDGGAPPAAIERMSMKFPTSTAAVFAIDPQGRASFDGLFHASDHGGQGE